jgi:hypothetical protein
MTTLEELKPGLQLEGILPGQPVTVIDVSWHGTQAVTLIYKRDDGQPDTLVLYHDDEQRLQLVQEQRRWPFDADDALFRLAAEAYRNHLAHLFDPVLAVHTSLIEPLPRQAKGDRQASPAPVWLPVRYAETGHRHGAEAGGVDCG